MGVYPFSLGDFAPSITVISEFKPDAPSEIVYFIRGVAQGLFQQNYGCFEMTKFWRILELPCIFEEISSDQYPITPVYSGKYQHIVC